MYDLSRITAVSFDVDGTLWDFETTTRHALQDVLDELSGIDPAAAEALDVERMVAIRDSVHAQMWGTTNDLDAIREESMRQALREARRPNDELGSYLTRLYFERRNRARSLFPGTRAALEALAPRFKLGLLSNGNSRARVLGIEDLISFEVFSQDHNAMDKPDSRIFQIAMRQAACLPHQLLHVGDSWHNDVLGALDSGAIPVFFNPSNLPSHDRSVTQVQSLGQLPLLLSAQHAAEPL